MAFESEEIKRLNRRAIERIEVDGFVIPGSLITENWSVDTARGTVTVTFPVTQEIEVVYRNLSGYVEEEFGSDGFRRFQ